MIKLRRLRILGRSENYDVDFRREDGSTRSLAVIAGEISTGKTAILEFVDYCLGRSGHPGYVEIQRQALSAQLEVDLSGEITVIERRLFTSEQTAWIHSCSVDELARPHATVKLDVGPAGDNRSLNWLLLKHSGLEGVILKEAPTRSDSATDPISFRDVMWLAFLDGDRMAKHRLLHEGDHMKNLKLRQLVEVIFEVHDQQLAAMGDRIALLERERNAHRAEIESLRAFLHEQEVGDRLELQAQLARLERILGERRERLGRLDEQMRAETTYADNLRATYGELRRAAGRAAAHLRDREVLLSRLLPLRGQYAEDERKLGLFFEAKRLFDPLQVRVCPSCLQKLEKSPNIENETCSLCRQTLTPEDAPIDVEAERRSIRARLRTLNRYIEEVEDQIVDARTEYTRMSADESIAGSQLDSDVSERLTPFVAQRDGIVREIEISRAKHRDTARQLGWLDGIDRRTAELERLGERIAELRAEQSALQADRPSRDVVIAKLSARYDELLRAFAFPKIDDPEPPFIDNDLVPYARGIPYSGLGSRGAITLVALAWQLTIFELAIEGGHAHPGFLMIDSPQAHLKPARGQSEDDFSRPEIVLSLWRHLAAWSRGAGANAQIVVVDHAPPTNVKDDEVVRYSGRADEPPYGLIANETASLE